MTYNIRNGLGLIYETFLSFGSINELNRVLTDVIISKIKDKKSIGIHLTGGKDTRVLLSILLKNNIDVTACLTFNMSQFKDIRQMDNEISSRICCDLGLNHILVPVENYLDFYRYGNEKFDIVLSGKIMGGILNGGFIWERPMLHSFDIYNERVKEYNLLVPFINNKVLLVCNRIPFYFKMAGIIHKKLIKINYPKLLKYPFTRRI